MRRNDSKALARIKRIYNSGKIWYINKFDKLSNVVTLHTIKACESITDFLENSKYAKLLKKTRVLNKNKSKKLEQKKSTKHSRTEAKEQIKQGIEEYNAAHTCSSLCKGCMYIDNVHQTINTGIFKQELC